MKKNKILIGSLLIATLITSCSKDEFAKINTDPSIVEPEVKFLFSDALINADPQEYLQWFYNNSMYYLPWNQATVSSTGNQGELNLVKEVFYQNSKMIVSKSNYEEIRKKVSAMTPEVAAPYTYLVAMSQLLNVYMGVYGTDTYGSMAYSEVATKDPIIMRPAYQTQEDLFTTWLGQLNSAIDILSNPVKVNGAEVSQIALGSQDFVYKGDASKWVKFANALKLRVAARLLAVDKARAIKIAEEVASNSAGIMNSSADDFIWNPGSQYYHFNNDIAFGVGSSHLIDFLVKNKDPRVRFLYKKNKFNAAVTAQFIKEGKSLPSYIDKYVEYKTDASGNKEFAGWKAPGEPWVRFHGAPVDFQAKDNPTYIKDYYNTKNFQLEDSKGSTYDYTPMSFYNEEMIRGQATYNYPAIPGATVIKDETAQPFYTALISSAEVNLYLAEFKLLGANIPGTAESYFKAGVELSVGLMNRLAQLNNIPYYPASVGGAYTEDSNESVALKSGEIETLMTSDDYKLTGSALDQLEKVYIQQYLHFLYMPNEQFVLVRRSGIPKVGSKLLPRLAFDQTNASYVIPRRLKVEALNPSDQLYSIKDAAFKAEGFTPGATEPSILATERVWYDKGAPAFGAGPNM